MILNSPPTLEKRKYFMHYMHKPAVDVTFTQMTVKKDIKNHVERAVAAMYKEYKKMGDMNVMWELKPNSLIISQKKVELGNIK